MFKHLKKVIPTNIKRRLKKIALPSLQVEGPFSSHPGRLIIDITTSCNLHCKDCNRSCNKSQAPSNEHMSPHQIQKFVEESLEQNRLWDGKTNSSSSLLEKIRIKFGDPSYAGLRIEGGEPTMSPYLFEILDILLRYKDSAPETKIVLVTNGYSPQIDDILKKIPRGIKIINTNKKTVNQNSHCFFNMAPIDDERYKGHDFSNGCWLPMFYGIGLTRHGFYPHPVCGNIDRVLGFNIGLRNLPPSDFSWSEHYKKLCPYCGHYNRYIPSGPIQNDEQTEDQSNISLTWQNAYAKYKMKKPFLSTY